MTSQRQRAPVGPCDSRYVKAVYLRCLVDELRVVKGVGVFQQGSVAQVPGRVAVDLLATGDFELVTSGPLARVVVLRIGQDTMPSPDAAPLTRLEGEGAADFEQELEAHERQLEADGDSGGESAEPLCSMTAGRESLAK